MSARRTLVTLVAASILAAGCGEDEAADNAVEAQETNVVRIGDVRYRVTMFRQLNPRIPPDMAIYDAKPRDPDNAVMAAFIEACNLSDQTVTPTDEIHLEDAFGDIYRPVELGQDNPFAYDAPPIPPDDCSPGDASAADQTLPGAALVFEVPTDQLRERPFVLEINGQVRGENVERRVQLDL